MHKYEITFTLNKHEDRFSCLFKLKGYIFGHGSLSEWEKMCPEFRPLPPEKPIRARLQNTNYKIQN